MNEKQHDVDHRDCVRSPDVENENEKCDCKNEQGTLPFGWFVTWIIDSQ